MARLASRIRQGVVKADNSREGLRSLRYLLNRTMLDEINAVRRARKDRVTWREIADILGMTESGARRRYNAKGIE